MRGNATESAAYIGMALFKPFLFAGAGNGKDPKSAGLTS